MDISELWIIYSPHYEGTNNLIKWQFRLKRMVCQAWAKEHTELGSLLFKSNSLHITLYFEDDLCITVTYYLETKVTIIY